MFRFVFFCFCFRVREFVFIDTQTLIWVQIVKSGLFNLSIYLFICLFMLSLFRALYGSAFIWKCHFVSSLTSLGIEWSFHFYLLLFFIFIIIIFFCLYCVYCIYFILFYHVLLVSEVTTFETNKGWVCFSLWRKKKRNEGMGMGALEYLP